MATLVPLLHGHRPSAAASLKAPARFKDRVRDLTRRHRGVSLQRVIIDLNSLMRGWAEYFGFGQLHGWTRRRLRCVSWVRRKTLADATRNQGTQAPEGPREGGQYGHLQSQGPLSIEFVERVASRRVQQTLQGSWACRHENDRKRLIRRTAVVVPAGVGGVASRGVPLSRLRQASTAAAPDQSGGSSRGLCLSRRLQIQPVPFPGAASASSLICRRGRTEGLCTPDPPRDGSSRLRKNLLPGAGAI